jgi:hypothetical protein
MFIERGGVLAGLFGRQYGVVCGHCRRCVHCFRPPAPFCARRSSSRGASGMRAASTACIRGPMPCAFPALVYRSCLPTLQRRGCARALVDRSRLFAVRPGQRTFGALCKRRNYWTGKEIMRYLRVNSILGVPPVALEHAHSGGAVHVGKAHELADRSLLLRRVCWRHFVLALLCALLLKCRCSVAVGDQGAQAM